MTALLSGSEDVRESTSRKEGQMRCWSRYLQTNNNGSSGE
jgi:hypothetical protein